VDGNTNMQQFKVDAEEWARAVEQTRAAQYFTHNILIMNTDRKYVKELIAVIREAEGLLIAGQVRESIGKVREICDFLGHKHKNEENRYSKLKRFDLSDSEREGIVELLDALWVWSSEGHHLAADSNEYNTEEQAWMSIHMGFLILSYLSRKQMIQQK
jgi:hypothetical protein